MFRFLCLALVPLALVNAEYLYGEQPYVYNTEYASAYDNYKPRDYKFEYGVSDPHTGDHKAQWEVRENGVVRGAYSLLEADGTTRVVEYYADDTGFHADVKKLGTAVHDTPAVAPVVAPVIKATIADGIAYNGYGHGGLEHGYGAPIAAVQHAVGPVATAIEEVAPIAKVEHIAPVQQVIAPEIQPLAQYAPIHYQNYAPLLAKAAPVHVAHEYKLEHQVPYPQPVNTYHQEAPIDKYSPIAAAYFGQVEQNHYVQKAPIVYHKAAPAYSEQQIHFQNAAPAQSLYSHEINFAPAQEIKYAPAPELKFAPAQELKYAQVPEIKFAPVQEVKFAAVQDLKYAPAPELKYVPAPAQQIAYSHELKHAPAQEIAYTHELKHAPPQEIAYTHELKHAPAQEIAYTHELKHVPAQEIAYSHELKYAPAQEIVYSQELKHAPAQEIAYTQEIKHAPTQEIKYSHAPVNYAPVLKYSQDVKYTQTPSPIHYEKAPEQYQHSAPIYYQEDKPQHNVQILHKAAPSVDYEALNYFGAAGHGYKPEVKYDQYDHQGY